MSGASSHLFLEWINVGTVLALLIFFRHRIVGIFKTIVRDRDYRLLVNVIIAMLPAGVVGFLAADVIESQPLFASPYTVVVTLATVGVLLVVIDKIPHLSEVTEETMPKNRALAIGLAQVLALVPGTSRSGSTILAGRMMGLNAERAAEFSFLVSIPIMLGVITKLLIKTGDRVYLLDNFSMLVIANLAALISGLIAVKFLMGYLKKHSLSIFGWYRIGLALVLATILLIQ